MTFSFPLEALQQISLLLIKTFVLIISALYLGMSMNMITYDYAFLIKDAIITSPFNLN
ncbi:hypothetical protein SALWKB12_1589 [Snodgrassella communis]|uniref:Uncharacterized protein n=1 Tax=Snodgrassella communis TaxID=2946699 RepID=A0A836MQS8_9NEIS|nr:hypothetical protein SALWKB12_1589 [Snodgrassella communis]KDN14533.1 hypothetical protein SALWKB29_1323 [Snodgrassella communis]